MANPFPGFGQEPKGSPAARGWSILLGLLLLALAVVTGREAWLMSSGAKEQSWVQPVLDIFATPQLEDWMVWAGVAASILGIILLIVALKPRRSTHRQMASDHASVWMRPVDIARVASAAARRVPGVDGAQTKATGRRVNVNVASNGDSAALTQNVEQAVSRALVALREKPEVNVNVHKSAEVGSNV